MAVGTIPSSQRINCRFASSRCKKPISEEHTYPLSTPPPPLLVCRYPPPPPPTTLNYVGCLETCIHPPLPTPKLYKLPPFYPPIPSPTSLLCPTSSFPSPPGLVPAKVLLLGSVWAHGSPELDLSTVIIRRPRTPNNGLQSSYKHAQYIGREAS